MVSICHACLPCRPGCTSSGVSDSSGCGRAGAGEGEGRGQRRVTRGGARFRHRCMGRMSSRGWRGMPMAALIGPPAMQLANSRPCSRPPMASRPACRASCRQQDPRQGDGGRDAQHPARQTLRRAALHAGAVMMRGQDMGSHGAPLTRMMRNTLRAAVTLACTFFSLPGSPADASRHAYCRGDGSMRADAISAAAGRWRGCWGRRHLRPAAVARRTLSWDAAKSACRP